MVSAAVLPQSPGKQKRFFALCLGAGGLGAAVLAVLRRVTAINRGMVNTVILSIALLGGIFFLISLWTKRKRIYSGGILSGALLFYALPSLFLLPSDFVMAGQSVFSTEFLANLAGACAGVLAAVLAGLMLYRGGAQNAGTVFLFILSAAVFVNMLNQAASVIQFLIARRIIPLNRSFFKVITLAINNQPFFMFAEIGLSALVPLRLLFLHPVESISVGLVRGVAESAGKNAETPVRENPAVRRKQKALARLNRRRNIAGVVLLGFTVFALTGLKAWNERAVELSPAEPFTLAGDEISIPVSQIEDGHLHRFAWNTADNTEVRFIVVKKSASAWGVGLDACDICGNTGYYERRDGIICRLCDVVMNKSTIGFKGGCNPVPLAYTVRDGSMIVLLRDLEQEKSRFK
jgi:uncharacterized membrane protein